MFQVYHDETQEETSESESESESDEESTLKNKKNIHYGHSWFTKGRICSRKKKKKGSGLKILKPNPMFRRLPITLAQVKAGNNSEKLKNEIR